MNTREDFDRIANDIFFPIYEVIAKDALKLSGQKSGHCLDIGCCGGHLGKASDMRITLLDINEDAIKIAKNRIKEWGLMARAPTMAGADDYAAFLNELDIEAKIINDYRGVWIMMKKPAQGSLLNGEIYE